MKDLSKRIFLSVVLLCTFSGIWLSVNRIFPSDEIELLDEMVAGKADVFIREVNGSGTKAVFSGGRYVFSDLPEWHTIAPQQERFLNVEKRMIFMHPGPGPARKNVKFNHLDLAVYSEMALTFGFSDEARAYREGSEVTLDVYLDQGPIFSAKIGNQDNLQNLEFSLKKFLKNTGPTKKSNSLTFTVSVADGKDNWRHFYFKGALKKRPAA